jgi:hypothetical protein
MSCRPDRGLLFTRLRRISVMRFLLVISPLNFIANRKHYRDVHCTLNARGRHDVWRTRYESQHARVAWQNVSNEPTHSAAQFPGSPMTLNLFIWRGSLIFIVYSDKQVRLGVNHSARFVSHQPLVAIAAERGTRR